MLFQVALAGCPLSRSYKGHFLQITVQGGGIAHSLIHIDNTIQLQLHHTMAWHFSSIALTKWVPISPQKSELYNFHHVFCAFWVGLSGSALSRSPKGCALQVTLWGVETFYPLTHTSEIILLKVQHTMARLAERFAPKNPKCRTVK